MEQGFEKANLNFLPAVDCNMILYYFASKPDYVNVKSRTSKQIQN